MERQDKTGLQCSAGTGGPAVTAVDLYLFLLRHVPCGLHRVGKGSEDCPGPAVSRAASPSR
jgi:hypothetical protein